MKLKPIIYAFALSLLLLASSAQEMRAQGPRGRSFGFGLQLGEPSAITGRVWTSKLNSWDMAIGASYLGSPHIQAGYLWHFPDAFNSQVVFLYAGVGGILGFRGDETDGWFIKRKNGWYHDNNNSVVLAVRGAFGINVVPNRTPLDIFFEVDPIVGVSPEIGFDFMPSIGIRFYP